MNVHPNSMSTAVVKTTITGKSLAQRVPYMSASERALLAHDIARGEVEISRPTLCQAVQLARANRTYASRVARLSSDDREKIRDGSLKLPNKLPPERPLSDADIDQLIEAVGVQRFWEAIDRYTQPCLEFAAE
jgi:hypothetical protein